MQLGCGLYGYAFELQKDLKGALKYLKEVGYSAIEPLYTLPDDPSMGPESPIPDFVKALLWDVDKVKSLHPYLDEIGLSISSMHVGLLFCDDTDLMIKSLPDFAEKTGVTHFITSLEFDTIEKADNAARLMNHAEELLRGTGVTLGYHNHKMEFNTVEINGEKTTLMEYFLGKLNENIKIQLDVGWQMVGGGDIIPFIKKYASRIQSVHLKDFIAGYDDIPEEEAFAAIGEGVLPLKEILDLVPSLNLFPCGLMIDQDRAAKNCSIADDLKKGAENVRALLP